jgi:hypothetical protein
MTSLDTYLTKHVTDKTLFNKALNELIFTLKPEDPDRLTHQLKQWCADTLYAEYIEKAPKNFIIGSDPYPQIRTTSDRYGIKTPSQQTIYNRTQPIIKIYKELGLNTSMFNPILYYDWLAKVDEVVAATQRAYTKKSTFQLAALAIIQLCEACGFDKFKTAYHQKFATVEVPEDEPAPPPLTKSEVSYIRELNQTVIDKAYSLLENKGINASDRECSLFLEALSIETMYGCSSKHEPLRNDWLNVQMTDRETDLPPNFVFLKDGLCTLHVTEACKVTLKEPLVIDLRCSSPRLAKLMHAVYPIAKVKQHTDYPYVLWSKGKQMNRTQLSSRMPAIWRKLGFDPGPNRRGCNGARHASVNENRKRRKLSTDERTEEQDQARRRMSSVHMAETVYA